MPESLHIANARIWTGDYARPWADSLYAIGERVMSAKDAAFFDEHRTIDARGCVIVPGLIDAHTHLLMGGKSLTEVDLSAVRSRDEFETVIARAHAGLPADRWLIGRGWSEQNWSDHAMP
ncbi:MAG TPA: amidohydrolase family protein, partial [Roseiflexaceae bacterium]|nr:amidohydrolase family protein [Roseiflexaceae bacterium]